MDWIKILSSVVAPSLLFFIGWRGIPPEKRKGALRVVFLMFAFATVGTAVYVAIIFTQSPKWIAADCAQAWAEISEGQQRVDPALAEAPFMAACQQLPMSAAQCTQPSYVAKFPDSCSRYVDQIREKLPSLDLGVPQRRP